MKIAVTGATGFIGRHVLTELARHDVKAIPISRHAATLPGASQVQLVTAEAQLHVTDWNTLQ
jgi:uncharacterized protein YbjT (DUF2867 family)